MSNVICTLPGFFAPLRNSPEELVHLRLIAPRNAPAHLIREYEKQKAPPQSMVRVAAYTQLTPDSKYVKEYRELNKRRGVYGVINPGGNDDLDIKRYVATYSESDPPEGADVAEFLASQLAIEPPLEPSAQLLTYKSLHRYWLIDGACSREEWLLLQQGQIAYYHSDPSIMNESRVMRLPGFNHVRVDFVNDCLLYKPIELRSFNPERRYSVARLQKAFPVGPEGLKKVYEKLSRKEYKQAGIEPSDELRKEIETINKLPRSVSGKASKDNSADKVTTLEEVLKRERGGEELKRIAIEPANYGDTEPADAKLIEGTIDRICLQLANARNGTKDSTLLHCGIILYALVKGQLVDEGRITNALLDAVALAAEGDPQFDPYHAEQTARNAFNYAEPATLDDLRRRQNGAQGHTGLKPAMLSNASAVATASKAVSAPKPEPQPEAAEIIREVLFDGRLTLEVTPALRGKAVLVARNCTSVLHRDELSLNKTSDRAKFVKELALSDDEQRTVSQTLLSLADRLDQATDTTGSADADFQPQSAATRLVALTEEIQLIHNSDGDGYAVLMIEGHKETWPLKSKGFKRWLQRLYFEQYGKAPGSQAVQDALGVIEGKALYDGPERKIFIRVGESNGKIYLDLADESWRAVEIDTEGWRVLAIPPVEFRRAKGMLPLPVPVAGGNLDELRPFLNLEKGDLWTLILGSLVMKLHPHGPYNVDVFTGGQGCGKTTRARIVRALIDPSSADTRSAPREIRDLHIAAVNEWLPTFDNLSSIQQWLSDGLCCLSTGGGSRTRELYSDSEEAIFSAKRPIILTSITEVVQQPDLLDRSIIYNLPQFEPGTRKPEKQLWAEFKKAHGGILGALLDAAVCALANEEKVVISEASRLADFERWAVAAEPKLGLDEGAFRAAYDRNRGSANDLALDSCPIAEPIINLARLMAAKPNEADRSWKGTAKELLDLLLTEKSDEDKRKLKEQGWPKAPSGLSAMLRKLAPNLRLKYVTVEFNIREGKKGSRKILISPLPQFLEDEQKEKDCETPSDIVSPSASTGNKGLTSNQADGPALNADDVSRNADGVLPGFRSTADDNDSNADGLSASYPSSKLNELKGLVGVADGLTSADGVLQTKSYSPPVITREVVEL